MKRNFLLGIFFSFVLLSALYTLHNLLPFSGLFFGSISPKGHISFLNFPNIKILTFLLGGLIVVIMVSFLAELRKKYEGSVLTKYFFWVLVVIIFFVAYGYRQPGLWGIF